MSLPSAVHVSSTFEFGAMLHDCLSVDPQVQSSIIHFFRSPMNVIAFSFMRSPPSSLELCVVIAQCNSPFSTPFSEPHELRLRSCILHPRIWSHA